MNNKKTISILMIFTIIFTVIGGSLAYWSWNTSEAQKTNVVFTINKDFSCAVDGGGNITSSNVKLAPTTCTDTARAIKREVKVTPTINRDGLTIYMDLWLDVNVMGSGLSASNNFKYVLTTSGTSCEEGTIVSSGTFTGTNTGSKVKLLSGKDYSSSTTDTYYLYVWLDTAEESSTTMNQAFSLSLNGSCSDVNTYSEAILNGADPVLETGMIPVTIANDGAVTTADTSSEWYSYEDKQWANAVLVNSTNRANYYESDGTTIKSNTTVNKDDILAYYVWVPRYRYAFPKADGNPESISIIFEDADTNKSTGTATGTRYYTHPAFTFGTDELNGIWVGKFEMTGSAIAPTILPNETSLNGTDSSFSELSVVDESFEVSIMPNVDADRANVSPMLADPDAIEFGIGDYFKVSLKFSGGTQSGSTVSFIGSSTYGLTANTNSHMMKNSEWGAVAYLSHSSYGIDGEIRINNNSAKLTGCGAATSSTTSYTSTCTLAYGSGIEEYPQSTTGNISGIFDMSGGAWEYVMGSYNAETNTYFETLPESKYYDLYPSSQFTGNYVTNTSLCTLATCGGHALNETKGWYSDYAYFVSSDYPWFSRGGSYVNGAGAGAFYFGWDDGGASSSDNYSWRSVLVVGYGA